MANEALKNVGRSAGVTTTPQSQKAAKGQKKNSAGGYTFVTSPLELAKRFLILGSDASYYDSAAKLTKQAADNLVKLVETGHSRELVDLVVEISTAGRAPKQQPGLFALAVAATHGTAEERHYAYSKLNAVARTASTLFTFIGYVTQFQRIGMGTQKAIRRWYLSRKPENLALQMVKYQNRDGFSHADLLKLARPKSDDPEFNGLAGWALRGDANGNPLPSLVQGFEKAKTADVVTELPGLIREHRLSWEMVPSEALNRKQTWDAFLDVNLPLGALLRNLPKLTNVGVIAPLGGRTSEIVDRLTDVEAIKNSRLHPLNILVALKTYASGQGLKGSQVWQPVQPVIDALDAAFYLAFPNVEPTGQRYLLANDISASMDWGQVAGVPLSPREAVGALSLVIQRTERESHIIGFTGYAGGRGSSRFGAAHTVGGPKAGGSYYGSAVTPIDISPKMRLDDVTKKMRALPMGGTDASLPMLYAIEQGLEVDTFIVLTDNDTWAGTVHPFEALKLYRKESGINSKLIVLATKGDKFSIADPRDPRMLDIPGFDTAVPAIIAEFSRDI